MKYIQFLPALFFLTSCGLWGNAPVIVIDNGEVVQNNSTSRIPKMILENLDVTVEPDDSIFVNGIHVPIDQPINSDQSVQLQIKHAVTIAIITPENNQPFQTSAFTVGNVLYEAGYKIRTNDRIDPPMDSPVEDGMQINYKPAQNLIVTMGDKSYKINSAADSVGKALAEAGIPLIGLDFSLPSENEPLPADGQIYVTRVAEVINIATELIPFSVETVESLDVPFGQDEIIQAGENGVAMVRTRVRYENGVETNHEDEGTITLREPVKQIVASGSKIVLSPAGGEIPYQYWYATDMYASVYSPCASGTGGCSYGTASGARAGYGIVAVDYSIYSYLAGMQVYIPGYGIGTIGDTGGGPIIESTFGVPRTKWIDLGFDDGNMVNMTGWVTVYFLAPAPAEIPYFLK